MQYRLSIPTEKYDSKYLPYDIAVLYLKDPLKLGTRRVQSFELAEDIPKAEEKCMVTGWGLTYFRSELGAPTLLATDLTIASNELCHAKHIGKITKDMICAKAPGTDACYGDSGGPLVSLHSHKLIGIVSWGHKCAVVGYPAVYASVAHFRNWTLKAIDTVQRKKYKF